MNTEKGGQCRVCSNVQGNTAYEVREMMYGYRETFPYFQCAKCKCLQITNIPQDMSKYYPSDYYSFTVRPDRPQHWLREVVVGMRDRYALFGEGLAGKLLSVVFPEPKLPLVSRMHVHRGTSLLDVGCGAGQLLYTMRERGMEKVLGVDPYIAHDLRYENGLTISKGSVHNQEGQWDVIMFNHSFEHMADPLPTLQAVYRLLKPGGQCMIRIPTVSSYAWEQYRENWVQLDAPRHFFLHSRESVELLATQAGLSLEEVVYDSTGFQFWASEQYVRDIPLHDPRSYGTNPSVSIFSKAQIRAWNKQAVELNKQGRGDAAAFYLRKP